MDPRGSKALGCAIRRRDRVLTLRSARAVVADMCRWLARVATASKSSERLFLAGDCDSDTRTSMCVPHDFVAAKLFRDHSGVADAHKARMMQQLAEQGWPPWLRVEKHERAHGAPKAESSNELLCSACKRTFSKLWVHRGVCCECEQRRRMQGVCPFNAACAPAAFCPHARKCFVCDAWSCATCRLTRGDSSDVLTLVEQVRPEHIFLDFDRTLATTRGGGSPLHGAHRADPELLGLFGTHTGRVHVVTRNSYRDDIIQFLLKKGVAAQSIDVHTVMKGQSKASLVCDKTTYARPGIFVDDSIAEHLDPKLREPGLHRVVFVRGR